MLLSHLTHEVRETGDHTPMTDTFCLKSTALYVLNILKLNKLLQSTGTTGMGLPLQMVDLIVFETILVVLALCINNKSLEFLDNSAYLAKLYVTFRTFETH